MVNNELFVVALSSVEKLHVLTERKYEETKSKRFIALNELTRKIRLSFNAIHYIPYEQYEVLYAPINLLYRSMITDLMTSLLLSVVDDKQLDDFLLIDNLKFVDALKSALDTDVEIRKLFDQNNEKEYDRLKAEYQINLFDDLHDCLSSNKNEAWIKKEKCKVIINGQSYNGNIKDMYNILKSSKELCGYAYLYKYYREFSQSEHFSMKGRYMNYKQDFHDKYYNKVLGFIHLGEKYIYDKYNN